MEVLGGAGSASRFCVYKMTTKVLMLLELSIPLPQPEQFLSSVINDWVVLFICSGDRSGRTTASILS